MYFVGFRQCSYLGVNNATEFGQNRWALGECQQQLPFVCQTPTCADSQFRCRDGRKCVNAQWICDGTPDCDDMSDELGCNGESLLYFHMWSVLYTIRIASAAQWKWFSLAYFRTPLHDRRAQSFERTSKKWSLVCTWLVYDKGVRRYLHQYPAYLFAVTYMTKILSSVTFRTVVWFYGIRSLDLRVEYPKLQKTTRWWFSRLWGEYLLVNDLQQTNNLRFKSAAQIFWLRKNMFCK